MELTIFLDEADEEISLLYDNTVPLKVFNSIRGGLVVSNLSQVAPEHEPVILGIAKVLLDYQKNDQS
jgi:hypothetical protein